MSHPDPTSAPTSLALRLYGTDEPVAPPRLLRAGPLSAELVDGNLRYIRFGPEEVLRAISFVTRDKDWGTYAPDLRDLMIFEDADSFSVTYQASAADIGQSFSYCARIEGRADGSLVFQAKGRASGPFVTNRTGFVILHPIDGIAGQPARITHVDGRVVDGGFPALIDPVQPMMDLRELTHTSPGGLHISCKMEGDTYEMEDQRNWTDASYKTYVRPLAKPWPYRLDQEPPLSQKITLQVQGQPAAPRSDSTIRVRIGADCGTMPKIGMGLQLGDVAGALSQVAVLHDIGLDHLICHYDPRMGHGLKSLRDQASLANAMGVPPWLEAVIVSTDDFAEEIAELGRLVARLGAPFQAVLLSPAPDLKCTLPGSVWPQTPPAADIAMAARAAFPGKVIGGGMFSYFTELNRKPPPAGMLDLVSFTTCAAVHAGDDRSVMETLQALPAIAASARAIAGDTPFAVGPSAIGMRDNPYGAAPKPNPGNIRQAMALQDPRTRGLLGAAWALGYVAQMAAHGASAITIGAPVGPFGVLRAAGDSPQPGWERPGQLYPAYHVMRGMAWASGGPMRQIDNSAPTQLAALAVGNDLWLANLTAGPLEVDHGLHGQICILDAESFVEATARPDFMARDLAPCAGKTLLLGFAVARIVVSG